MLNQALSRLFDRLTILRQAAAWVEERWSAFNHGRFGQAVKPWVERLRRLGLVSSPGRFVLTIGDEGATLVQFRGRNVVDALFVGPETEDGLETLRGYLLEDPQAQVVVSADVLEQMYREEQLPRVSRWDRLSIVKRRLDIAFPHDRLKAAVPLDRGKGGSSATVLFTALPATEAIEKWIGFLEDLPNPVTGFCLLPLESEGLAARLSPSTEGEERRVWHALVSQQATSGFRQIFESEGNLAVTRLTQRPPGELTAAAGALLIERELRSSISYVKRLGYTDLDRLDLVVLADPEICAAVNERDLPVTTLIAMTPRQAGERLGFGAVGPEDSPFADVLHAVNLALKRRPKAILATEKLRERLTLDAVFKVGFAAAAAITLVAILNLASMALDAFDALTTAKTLEQAIATETQVLNALRQQTHRYEIPIQDVVAVVQTEDALTKAQVDPADIMRALGKVLDPTVRVQKIVFSTPPTALVARPIASAPGLPPRPVARGARKEDDAAYEVHLTLRFLGEKAGQSDETVLLARGIKDRLDKELPGHDVTVVHLPSSLLHNQVLTGTAGAGPVLKDAGPPQAEYLVRKRL